MVLKMPSGMSVFRRKLSIILNAAEEMSRGREGVIAFYNTENRDGVGKSNFGRGMALGESLEGLES